MKNNYVARRKAEIDEIIQIARRVEGQFYVDTLQFALSQYDKLDLGYQRILEISELWERVREEHRKALTGDPEADVAQEHLDAGLIQITKDPALILPFPARYPELKKITYGGKKK